MVWFVYEMVANVGGKTVTGNAFYQKFVVGPLVVTPRMAYITNYPVRHDWPKTKIVKGHHYPIEVVNRYYPKDYPEHHSEDRQDAKSIKGFEILLLSGHDFDNERSYTARGLRLRAFHIGDPLQGHTAKNSIFAVKDDAVRWAIECRLKQEHVDKTWPSFSPMQFPKSRIGNIEDAFL